MKTKASISIAGIAVFLVLIAAVSAVNATVVKVDPASQTVLSGGAFSVNITVEDVQNLKADQAYVWFNPAAMQVIAPGATEGDFLPSIGADTAFTFKLDNTAGWIKFMDAYYPATDPFTGETYNVSGSGTLATIYFKAVEGVECTYNLNLTDIILVNVTGDTIPTGVSNGTVILDETPPTVEITSPADGYWFDTEDVLISFRPWDNKDQLLNYSIFVDDEEVRNGTALNYTVTEVNLGQTIPECNHVIRVNVTDDLGLEGSAQITIHVDRTHPTVEIISPADGEWFDSEPVNVTFYPWDNKADMLNYSIFLDYVEVANGTAANCTNKEVSLGILLECDHVINVTVEDKAGKMNFTQITVNVDLTPPTVEIIEPIAGNYSSGCVRLNYTADDPGDCPSGINWTAYNLDGAGNVTITANTTIPGIDTGAHTLIVYVKDKADKQNSSEVIFAIYIADIVDDGIVNVLDLSALSDAAFTVPGDPDWNIRADLNCDNIVNVLDLNILADNAFNEYWGQD